MEETQQQLTTETTTARIKNGWTAMSQAKRAALIAGVVIALAGAGIYAGTTAGSDYVVLYSGLDYKTAGEIKQALTESGITHFKLASDGTSILVKASEVDSIRMDLAVSGITPDSGIGYELFDNSQIGMTEQERQVMYQRALEGELRRSIISLDGVDDARVHLNLTEESVFNRDPKKSTASVILSVRRGVQITDSQVSGIMALVSGAVQNLSAENIEIIDSNGNLLSSGQGYSSSGSNDLLSQKAAYEKHLEDKVRSMAGKIFGFNDMIVAVNVDLNQSSEEQRKEEYTDGSVISEETHFTREDGVASGPESSSPLDNNMENPIVDKEGVLQNPDVLDYDNITNYQPTVTETHTVKPPGEVEKISVSFVYNGELTQPLIEELELLIASAVGINAERGDSLRVAGIPFNETAMDSEFASSSSTSSSNLMSWVYAALGVTAAAVVAFLMTRRKQQETSVLGESHELDPMMVPDYDNQENSDFEVELAGFMEQRVSDPVDMETLRLTVLEFFQTELSPAMELLRLWMHEEEPSKVGGVELDGMDKAARLLVLLGQEITTNVMRLTTQEEIVRLAHLIAGARMIPVEQSALLLEEFAQMIEARNFMAQGGYEFAKASMISALGNERAEQLLRKIKGAPRNKRPFEIIRHMEASQLYNALAEEHPQTIALVLCYLPDEKAAAIISQLPEQMQLEVVQRIGMMNNTTAQIVDEVENVIEARLHSLMSTDMANVGGLNTVVGILNVSDRATQKHLIDLLAQTNPRLAEEVRDSLFTFEDLILLEDTAIQRVIREVEPATLALSLKGASAEIFDLIRRNMSTKAGERLQEDIEYLGAVRISDVEKAQYDIITIVRQLEDSGEITISRGGSDDVIY